jgi:hypothetical protein
MLERRKTRWSEHVARSDELGNCYIIPAGKHRGKKQFRRLRCREENHVKIILGEEM